MNGSNQQEDTETNEMEGTINDNSNDSIEENSDSEEDIIGEEVEFDESTLQKLKKKLSSYI